MFKLQVYISELWNFFRVSFFLCFEAFTSFSLSLLYHITAAVATNHFSTLGINKLSSYHLLLDSTDCLSLSRTMQCVDSNSTLFRDSNSPQIFQLSPQRLAAPQSKKKGISSDWLPEEREREVLKALRSHLPN